MTPPPEVLAAYPVLAGVTPEPIDSLINQTFRLRGARGSFILQRVHPVFSAAIHTNIEAVTRHLAGQAFPTPTLVPTVDGALCLDTKEGVWRVLTCIEGETHDRASGPQWLESAGDLVGRFHRALAELNHEFVGLRHGVHDTPAHLRTLESALAERADHRLFADVASIAEALRVAAGNLPPLPELAPRPCHGDLKLSNVLFRGPEAHCLIDLDTLAPMHLGYEVGDALRSWCNPHREDEAGRASFELPFFSAAWTGYARGRAQPIPEAERRAVLYGVEHVCLELTARFLGDALLERYFGFDPQRYPGRGEHNLARARGQWALFRAVQACREARARVLDL